MKTVLLAMIFALAGCSPSDAGSSQIAQKTEPDTSASEQEAHPRSDLPIIPVTVNTGEVSHEFATELAQTPEEQARGLMFRTQLGDFEGMLFPSKTRQVRSFWMKNTPLPLDIIFIAPDGRIANIARGEPYSTDSVRSEGPAVAVLEIRGGRAEELGIEPGDSVEW